MGSKGKNIRLKIQQEFVTEQYLCCKICCGVFLGVKVGWQFKYHLIFLIAFAANPCFHDFFSLTAGGDVTSLPGGGSFEMREKILFAPPSPLPSNETTMIFFFCYLR